MGCFFFCGILPGLCHYETSRANGELMSQDEKTYEGQCYCGAVTIEVTGDPEGAGYCHCAACRSWSAGPVNAFTLWKPEAVKVTQGEDQIGEYNKHAVS